MGQRSRLLKWITVVMVLVGVVTLTGLDTVKVLAIDPDPASGTAIQEIEDAIAKGREAVGVGTYVLGGGHGVPYTDASFDFPNVTVDCSSFVAAAYARGGGIDITGEWGAPSARGYLDSPWGTYKRSSLSLDSAERGDLIVNNNGDHVSLYIGQDGDGTHWVMDAVAPEYGIMFRPATWPLDSKIIGIIDMGELIAKGEGTAYTRVEPDAINGRVSGIKGNDDDDNNTPRDHGDQRDPFEPIKKPLIKYDEHRDRGYENKGVDKEDGFLNWLFR